MRIFGQANTRSLFAFLLLSQPPLLGPSPCFLNCRDTYCAISPEPILSGWRRGNAQYFAEPSNRRSCCADLVLSLNASSHTACDVGTSSPMVQAAIPRRYAGDAARSIFQVPH